MLNQSILTNAWKKLPLVFAQRFRVRNLPQEKYDLSVETPYMPKRKPKKSFSTEFLIFANQKDWLKAYMNLRKIRQFQDMVADQAFIPERHQILGPDLATAHFICARNGKVKFKDSNRWITSYDLEKKLIPCKYEEGYFVEEIDASGTILRYEGFQNLCDLTELKKLILRDCPYVDDWCLSRSYLFKNTLEYLDISGCDNVTDRGICALHHLKFLKTLVLDNNPKLPNKELVCLLLQDVIPELQFVGVDLDDPNLLKLIDTVSN